ncbi:MAG: YncE family protein, partial [Bryobacteraceae bacterium]
MFSRRQLVLAAATLACRRKRATGFPGYALVATPPARSVAAVNLSTFSLARQIPLPAAPGPLLAHPSKPLAWALAPDSGLLCELDLAGLRLARQLQVARAALSMRLAEDAKILWVLCRDPSQLVAVRLDRLQRVARIPLAAEPLDFDLAHALPWAAVAYASSGAVSFVDLEAARSLPPVAFGRRASLVRFRSDGRLLLAA